jgi:hypothetical protein
MAVWYRKFMQEGKENTEERPVDAEQVLLTLAGRWRGALTLEYRSQLTLTHQGEPGLRGAVRVQLRRPSLARVVLTMDNPEFCCLRVCDGRVLWHRGQGTPLRPAATQRFAFQGELMQAIPHPLDEASYSVDQFLAPRPFWLGGAGVERKATRKQEKKREIFVVTQSQGVSKDTLILDARTYAPLRLVRVGDHGGTVQELLREEFQEVVMGGALTARLFRWNPEDEARS